MKAKEKMWFTLATACVLLFGLIDPFNLGNEDPTNKTQPPLLWQGAIALVILWLFALAYKFHVQHRGKPWFYIKPFKRK